jgi:hypothetical protein
MNLANKKTRLLLSICATIILVYLDSFIVWQIKITGETWYLPPTLIILVVLSIISFFSIVVFATDIVDNQLEAK